jgi:murein tripeptide amidase MpaA
MRWIGKWSSLIVAIIALTLSVYVVIIDNLHYQDLTKPHTEHVEIKDKLDRLDYAIEQARQDIIIWRACGEDTSSYENTLGIVISLRRQADEAWIENNYSEANSFINQAYDSIKEISPAPLFSPPSNWLLIYGIMTVGIFLAVIIWLMSRKRYT